MDIYRFLEQHGIEYQRFDHPAVFTCEQVNHYIPDLPGAKTKNLFLCDDKGRDHFLVVVGDTKQVDLKSLASAIGVKKIRFASARRLSHYLGLEPGAVTILGLVNDIECEVKIFIDIAIWDAPAIQCHPLVNTSTLVIPQQGIRRFLEATRHQARTLSVPTRQ